MTIMLINSFVLSAYNE